LGRVSKKANPVTNYLKVLNENVFAMMELLHQPYEDIMAMPVKRFYDILQLKVKLDEEREKAELKALGDSSNLKYKRLGLSS
jgi:hypothetical protein